MSDETQAVSAAQLAGDIPSEDEGYRVYVGNLSYKATEEEVREFMNKAGGEIISIVLPQKFKRPAGFAFVMFKNEADAKNAVEKLNGEELGDRKLALQIARSREEQAERRQAHIERREAARAARGPKEGEEGGEGEDAKKKRRSPRRTSRRRQPGEEDDEAEAEANGDASDNVDKPKKTKSRKPKAAAGRIDGEEGEALTEKKPRERKPRQPKLELTGENSPNTIFVANLPFEVDDEALSSIFTNLSIRVKSAKVVMTTRRGRGGKPFRASRGFGFVEVEDPAQQAEAVEKAEGSLIGDRKISAKVAQEMKPIEGEEVAEAQAGEAA